MEITDLKSLSTLEFDKITALLANKAATLPGKEKCCNLKPMTDISEIRLAQAHTSEAVSMILRKGSLSFGSMKDVSPSVQRVRVGGTLSIPELLQIGDFLRSVSRAAAYGRDEGKTEAYPLLKPMLGALIPLDHLVRELDRCILNEQEMADDASAALYGIRRNIKTANERIREHLNSIIHSQTYKNILQDSVITMRGGRFCVPVRSDAKNQFQGIVHDQSSTGATLFMEPMSVVNLNNRLKELATDEIREIEKILAKLSSDVNGFGDEILSDLKIMVELDFIFAKGEFSLSINGTEPIFNSRGYINIKRGRHPLLDKTSVVPTDIYLGGDFTTLLITGPNTGGKTVSLKTVGLFTLMGQAGLHISAFDNSELAVFGGIYADIGDEQSIEQSLSTFSGHMTNIVKILDKVTDDSLVLLDELGAGTDPTEGAALAVSILQYLLERGIRCAVTTHYSELKVYALSTGGIENASCEFDVDSLKPTYKLLIGIPGKSNAFAISKRLGLPDFIIDRARETLSKEDKRFEDLLTDLEISRKTVLFEQERAMEYRREAESLKADTEAWQLKLKNQRERILEEAREEARLIMLNTKNEADSLIKQLNKSVMSADRQDAENLRGKIREGLEGLSIGEKTVHRKVPESLRVGDGVYIHSLKRRGVVAGEADAGGDLYIKAGIMKVKVNISDLSLDEDMPDTVKSAQKTFSARAKIGKSMFISPEIDLRGQLTSEAVEKCDKYLDDAYLAGLKQVTIIHGKGTGALRAAITNHLKTHPHVEGFRLGGYGEGETGVTVCELK